jgi:hypothetical protein
MTKRHPTQDWEWEDYAEESFQEWFNDLYGPYSLRAEWFYGDCEIGDEKQRKDILVKWLHSAYISGYNVGRLHETKVGLTE